MRGGNSPLESLRVKRSVDASPNSLSRIHSDSYFPFHTDTAHWIKPARYLVLSCCEPGSGNRSTVLSDWNRMELDSTETDFLRSTPFRVFSGGKSFYSTILAPHRAFVRFDLGCMVADEPLAQEYVSGELLSRLNENMFDFQWSKGSLLIIDNWRILHGRSASTEEDFDRLLYRVLVT